MTKSLFQGLKCIKCGTQNHPTTASACKACGGVLTGVYRLKEASWELKRGSSIWQFSSLFPPISEDNITTLGEGWTPYLKIDSYGEKIGVKGLWCKLEGVNPTGSFKDRAASLIVSLAKEWGKEGIFTASTGNAAAAISAYAARGGISSLVLVREDSTPSKIGQISMYGPTIIRVKGLFSTKENLFDALARTQEALPTWQNGFMWAPINPLAVDALKTISYEIAAERIPDYVFVPTAGGDLLFGIYKGFAELREAGLIEKVPRMVAVQGENASPLVRAIEHGLDHVEDTEKADTIAGALRINFGADHPLIAVRRSGGFGVGVSDQEILEAHRHLAKTEGIFAEISSCTALAAVKRAVEEGRVSPDEEVAVILTGSGFKDYLPDSGSPDELPLAESADQLPDKIRGLLVRKI